MSICRRSDGTDSFGKKYSLEQYALFVRANATIERMTEFSDRGAVQVFRQLGVAKFRNREVVGEMGSTYSMRKCLDFLRKHVRKYLDRYKRKFERDGGRVEVVEQLELELEGDVIESEEILYPERDRAYDVLRHKRKF